MCCFWAVSVEVTFRGPQQSSCHVRSRGLRVLLRGRATGPWAVGGRNATAHARAREPRLGPGSGLRDGWEQPGRASPWGPCQAVGEAGGREVRRHWICSNPHPRWDSILASFCRAESWKREVLSLEPRNSALGRGRIHLWFPKFVKRLLLTANF